MDPMNPVNLRVSVIDPINPAVERVKLLLFAPFDLGRWFVIGFCAWLAQLGRWNGGGGNAPGGGTGPSGPADALQRAREAIAGNLGWIVPLGIVLFVLGIGIALLFTWLSSRGRFMFLDCVARNVAHVRAPWHRFRNHAMSLFLFRIVVGLIALALMAAVIAPGIFLGVAAHVSGIGAVSIIGLIALGLIFLIIVILFAVVGLFTTDFVVPLMYLHALSCTQAWRMFLDLLSWNQGRFLLYVLFQIFLKIAITTLVVGAACVTCGCACCFLALPYIGTVVLLPVSTFVRSYSAYYLSQYGPQFNVFAPAAPPTPQPA